MSTHNEGPPIRSVIAQQSKFSIVTYVTRFFSSFSSPARIVTGGRINNSFETYFNVHSSFFSPACIVAGARIKNSSETYAKARRAHDGDQAVM
jgi:hypothetical protein